MIENYHLKCGTGASSGIGRATALLFSRLGAQLSITGRKEENLTHLKEECEQNSKEKISVSKTLPLISRAPSH